MNEKLKQGIENQARFAFPKIKEELGEIERAAKEYFPEVDSEGFVQKFIARATSVTLEPLSEGDWATLQNSDSYQIAVGDWNGVEACAEAHDPSRNWMALRTKIGTGTVVDAPIIVRKNDALYLVAGNTRLMVTRALGRTPQVLIVDMTDYE